MNGKSDTGLTLNQLKFVFAGALVFFKLAPHNNISHWSWWWVLSPLWAFDLVLVVFLAFVFISAFLSKIIETIMRPPRNP